MRLDVTELSALIESEIIKNSDRAKEFYKQWEEYRSQAVWTEFNDPDADQLNFSYKYFKDVVKKILK